MSVAWTFRPELPLRWYERALAALGIPFQRRLGDPVPVTMDRYSSDSAVYFIDPEHGPVRLGGDR